MLSVTRRDIGHFALFQTKSPVFVGAEGLEPPTSTV